MKAVGLAALGWLVPGGAYLPMRRYGHFAVAAILVSVTFAAGLALQGAIAWPQAGELQHLDTFTAWVFQAAALLKLCAGGPFVLAGLFTGAHSFPDGRLHEYGTTLLMLAGLFNLLAVSAALELRKAER